MVLTIIFTVYIDNPTSFAKETQVPIGVARVGPVTWLPHTAESKGWQNEYFKWKKSDLLPSTNFKLLRQM
jgi:hypothetical protein